MPRCHLIALSCLRVHWRLNKTHVLDMTNTRLTFTIMKICCGKFLRETVFLQLPTAPVTKSKKTAVEVSNHQRPSRRQQFRLNCCFIDTPSAHGANKYRAADSWKTLEYEMQSFLAVLHVLTQLNESSALFPPIRIGRLVRTTNLCVPDAPPRTLRRTLLLAYV